MLQKVKDIALSKTAKVAINQYLKAYGEIEEITIDSKEKSIEVKVLLDGEYDAFVMSVDRYEILPKDNIYFIRLNGIYSSRRWMNRVSSNYLEGRLFEIPPKYATIVKSLL